MKESLQIDIREGDKKWIFIPPSLSKKKHISTLQFANFLIINFNTVAPRVIYTHSNESTRNHLCLFLSFFSLSFTPSTNSPLNINPSEKLLSPFTVRAGRNRALSETGYRPPLPSMPFNFRFLFPPPPKKTTLSFRPQGNKLFQVIMVVVVVVASSFHSIRGTRK